MDLRLAKNERRSGHDRRGLSLQEQEALRCCRLNACIYVGIQKAFGAACGDLVLFQRSERSTTLCIPYAQLSPLSIQIKLSESAQVRRVAFRLNFPETVSQPRKQA